MRDHIAYGRLRLLLGAARHALELDVELAAVRFPRVLTRFGTTDGLLDGEDSRDGEQVARQPRAGRLHRLERSAGCGDDLHDKVSFAKGRHQLAAEQGQRGSGEHCQDGGCRDDQPGELTPTMQQALVNRLEPEQPLRFGVRLRACQRQQRGRRGDGQRDDERCECREAERCGERPEEAALQP